MMCEDVLEASQNVFVVAPNDIISLGATANKYNYM